MKSTKEKIEVMQAYEDGETLQIMLLDKNPCWTDAIIKKKEPEFRWGEFDYRIKPQEPQTDWSKVARGTAVLVRDRCSDDCEWKEAFFIKKDNDDSSHQFNAFSVVSNYWKHCKLDKSAPSIINWVKNTGETPNCDMVLARNIDGDIRYILIKSLGFEINYKSIVEYAIIE